MKARGRAAGVLGPGKLRHLEEAGLVAVDRELWEALARHGRALVAWWDYLDTDPPEPDADLRWEMERRVDKLRETLETVREEHGTQG